MVTSQRQGVRAGYMQASLPMKPASHYHPLRYQKIKERAQGKPNNPVSASWHHCVCKATKPRSTV